MTIKDGYETSTTFERTLDVIHPQIYMILDHSIYIFFQKLNDKATKLDSFACLACLKHLRSQGT